MLYALFPLPLLCVRVRVRGVAGDAMRCNVMRCDATQSRRVWSGGCWVSDGGFSPKRPIKKDMEEVKKRVGRDELTRAPMLCVRGRRRLTVQQLFVGGGTGTGGDERLAGDKVRVNKVRQLFV